MRVFIIILFLIVKNVQASESYSIQVGAFKNVSNIQKVKDRLFEYEIYLEPYKDMHRIHVVNIAPSRLKETLVKLRTFYPKAFILKRPKVRSTQTLPVRKSTTNFNKSFEPIQYKLKNTELYEPSLDSHTILKTRKSFL